jgi:hypothetical protein
MIPHPVNGKHTITFKMKLIVLEDAIITSSSLPALLNRAQSFYDSCQAET